MTKSNKTLKTTKTPVEVPGSKTLNCSNCERSPEMVWMPSLKTYKCGHCGFETNE